MGELKRFYFLFFLFGWKWKSGGMKKMSLNKFTHIPLLNMILNFFLKKVTNNHTKTCSKKIISSKNRNKLSLPSPKKSKEKKIRKKREEMLMPKKNK